MKIIVTGSLGNRSTEEKFNILSVKKFPPNEIANILRKAIENPDLQNCRMII